VNARFDDLVVTKWGARFQGQNFPCSVGRGGIGVKTGEGDGVTPVGTFHLAGTLFRNDRLAFSALNLPSKAICLSDIWSDDPTDPQYNHHISSQNHRFSHERLRRSDPLYDVLAIVTYNWPAAVPGKGSAIFLHKWRKPRHPTAGCIAFEEADLMRILAGWARKSRLIIRG
jgi:L,D-peptidoglycan transpeptidase YkuD (ErfK/YbiS/YcfS/YnhG family)